MNVKDAAVIACKVLAVYIVFETLNSQTRVFIFGNMNPNSPSVMYEFIFSPIVVIIAIYLWREGGNLISRSCSTKDDVIHSPLTSQQWVCLVLCIIGLHLLINSISTFSRSLFMIPAQLVHSSGQNQWEILISVSAGLVSPVFALILIIFSWPISKVIVYIQTFRYSDQDTSKILTTQSIALSLLGVWMLARLLPQFIQYSSIIFMMSGVNQSQMTQLATGAWIQICLALALILGARGLVGLFYMLRIWGNPFAKERQN